MAGAGYKLFNTGDVLTAAQVNTYLMEQTVMVFADAAARTTALSGVMAEGMMSYLKSTDSVEVYNGSAWNSVSASVATSLGFTAGKNKIINGDFAINQRAFSTTTTGGFGFDRWDNQLGGGTGTVTYSAQTFTTGAAPVSGYESKNYLRCVTTGQSAAGTYTLLVQKIEDVRTFANQTITISFWAKANSGTPKIAVELTQAFGTGGSPSSSVNTYVGQVTLSTSWARYSTTILVPSISGKTIGTDNNSSLNVNLWFSAGSTYDSRTGTLGIQTNTFDIWGVQAEAGSVATAFQTATGTLAGELAACQRYYFRSSASAIGTIMSAAGPANTTSIVDCPLPLPVTFRTFPTSVETSNISVTDAATNYSSGSWSISSNLYGTQIVAVRYTHGSAALTQFRPYYIQATTSAGYIGLSAEL